MINWLVRFKNKTFLLTFVPAVLAFVYQILGMFDIVPAVTQDAIIQGFTIVINILVAVGIIVDPTTAGVGDSEQALTYTEPKKR